MPKPSLRENILEAGLRVMFRYGYMGSGVRDIVAEANAPQGSFTNHFRSKEEFARAVLDRYFEHVKSLVAETLGNRELEPHERLKNYLDLITTRLANDEFSRGCLIGDFSLEAVQHSEPLRHRLIQIFLEWRQPFADCLAEAQRAGKIDPHFSASDLADFMLSSWQGAILRMKVERSAAPLERFKAILFHTVFKEPDHEPKRPQKKSRARRSPRVSRSRR